MRLFHIWGLGGTRRWSVVVEYTCVQTSLLRPCPTARLRIYWSVGQYYDADTARRTILVGFMDHARRDGAAANDDDDAMYVPALPDERSRGAVDVESS